MWFKHCTTYAEETLSKNTITAAPTLLKGWKIVYKQDSKMDQTQKLSGQNSIEFQPDHLPNFSKTPNGDRYKCEKCGKILLPPVYQTECGHRICHICRGKMFPQKELTENGLHEPVACPGNEEDCVQLYLDKLRLDRAANRELHRLQVYCKFADIGCKHQTQWGKVSEHEETCDYRPVGCPNEGCNKICSNSELESHRATCDFTLLRCKKCNTLSTRKDLNGKHKSNCGSVVRQCPVEALGCAFTGDEKAIDQHSTKNLQKHNQNIVAAIAQSQSDQAKLKENLEQLKEKLSSLEISVRSELPTTIANIQHDLLKSLAKLNVELLNTQEIVENCVTHKTLEPVLSKVNGLTHLHSIQEARIGQLEERPSAQVGDNSAISRLETTVALHDTRLAESDLRMRLKETASYNGKLLWKITNYTRRKADAVAGRTLSLYSQPFYSSHHGYKMCARVYLHGDGLGKGTHLSLFFVVMRGEYDALLQWPFRYRVTMSLLDQSGARRHITDTFRPDITSNSFRRPISDMNIASGCPLFAELRRVEGEQFIKDDTMFIGMSIDTQDITDPFP